MARSLYGIYSFAIGFGGSNHSGLPSWLSITLLFSSNLSKPSFNSLFDMIFKSSTILVLLSALSSYCKFLALFLLHHWIIC